MFVINLLGRLGNQMFEYAFGVAAMHELHVPFILDTPKSFILPKYFNISKLTVLYDKIPWLRIYVRKMIQFKRKRQLMDFTDCSLPKQHTIHTARRASSWSYKDAYYEGYFQSIE